MTKIKINKRLGQRYKELRERRDYMYDDCKPCTQDKLAKLLGIKKPQISELENGKREPTIKELKAYHKEFNVPMEYLLGVSDNAQYQNVVMGNNLGLSDNTIKKLKLWKENYKNDSLVNVINCLFDSTFGEQVLKTLALYLFTTPKTFYPSANTEKSFNNEYKKNSKKLYDDEDKIDIPEIQVINTGGMQTILHISSLHYLYKEALLDKLMAMKEELDENGKMPKLDNNTEWLITTDIEYIQEKWRHNGKRTSKKEQKR